MNEANAREWLSVQFDATANKRLAAFCDFVRRESTRQNLIAPSTMTSIWERHIVDSAQLLPFGPAKGLWIDIGSGAGFPGLVIALLREENTLLIEPRRRRAEFLEHVIAALNVPWCTVAAQDVQRVTAVASAISARAVASVSDLFSMAYHISDLETCWVLPKGRTALEELAVARVRWAGVFHVKRSITNVESGIVIATKVASR